MVICTIPCQHRLYLGVIKILVLLIFIRPILQCFPDFFSYCFIVVVRICRRCILLAALFKIAAVFTVPSTRISARRKEKYLVCCHDCVFSHLYKTFILPEMLVLVGGSWDWEIF